jgi:lipid A 3-O-deacylase
MNSKLALAFLMTCLPTVTTAEEVAGWQLHWDNDILAKGRTDRWYTNGLRLSWTFNAPPTSDLSKLCLDGSRWFLWDDKIPTLGYSVGQSMYTPSDVSQAAPQVNDRPWGAYLFFGVTAHAYKTDSGGSEFRATELKVGTTGRYALGEQVQSLIHRMTSSAEPQGWDQQLRARPGVQLSHARVYRIGDQLSRDYFGFQSGWGLATGTLRTYGNFNVAMSIGDLSGRNSPLLVGNEGDFVAQDFNNRPQFEKPFAFVAANITGVAHNYFLDGDTPYGKANIERKNFYTMLQWGVSIPLQKWIGKKWPRLVYSQSSRSSEFRSQTLNKDEQRQRWGTFSFQWDTDD